jgi:hypothetical protein
VQAALVAKMLNMDIVELYKDKWNASTVTRRNPVGRTIRYDTRSA